MTPADYCDAMARWWRDASAGDAPVASEAVKAEAREVYRDVWRHQVLAGTDHNAQAWEMAAARLRGAK